MKLIRILFGVYQAAISVFTLLYVFVVIYISSRPSANVSYNWPTLVLLFLLLVPAIIFCSCNAVKLLFPRRNIFAKWRDLTQTSIVFTVLWTLLFAYLLIFQTGIGSCQTSAAKTSPKVSSLQTGQIAPDFSMKDQLGNTISLSNLKGKIVLLDFWGVWCGPCRQKSPHTQKIYDRFKNQGLAVIGVHSAFRTEQTTAFIAENNYTFPTGIDPGHIAKNYGVTGWPTYYLIDKEGHITWGPKHAPPSSELIESLLKD